LHRRAIVPTVSTSSRGSFWLHSELLRAGHNTKPFTRNSLTEGRSIFHCRMKTILDFAAKSKIAALAILDLK
jgi:hypothetical protein